MKQVYATWHGYEIQVNRLSHFPGRVLVSTIDGTKPFTKFFYGYGVDSDNSGVVFVDDLENIRVVDDTITLDVMNEAIARADMLLDELDDMLNVDPFGPGDCLPNVEEEYDPAKEWDMMTASMRRGEG